MADFFQDFCFYVQTITGKIELYDFFLVGRHIGGSGGPPPEKIFEFTIHNGQLWRPPNYCYISKNFWLTFGENDQFWLTFGWLARTLRLIFFYENFIFEAYIKAELYVQCNDIYDRIITKFRSPSISAKSSIFRQTYSIIGNEPESTNLDISNHIK